MWIVNRRASAERETVVKLVYEAKCTRALKVRGFKRLTINH